MLAPGQIYQRIFQEKIWIGVEESGRKERHESVFHLSFFTRWVNCLLTSSRCFSLQQLRKVVILAWLLTSDIETSGWPKHSRAGETVYVSSQTHSHCFPLPFLTHEDTDRHSLVRTCSSSSSVYKLIPVP